MDWVTKVREPIQNVKDQANYARKTTDRPLGFKTTRSCQFPVSLEPRVRTNPVFFLILRFLFLSWPHAIKIGILIRHQ